MVRPAGSAPVECEDVCSAHGAIAQHLQLQHMEPLPLLEGSDWSKVLLEPIVSAVTSSPELPVNYGGPVGPNLGLCFTSLPLPVWLV